MENKEQKIVYIESRLCGTVNDCYLKDGWYVKMIVPAMIQQSVGAYVLLERDKKISKDLIKCFSDIGITLYDNDGELKSLNSILEDIADKWNEIPN